MVMRPEKRGGLKFSFSGEAVTAGRTGITSWLRRSFFGIFTEKHIEVNPALVINFLDPDGHFLADLHHIIGIGDKISCHLRNMDHAFAARENFHKSAERQNSPDKAFINL